MIQLSKQQHLGKQLEKKKCERVRTDRPCAEGDCPNEALDVAPTRAE